VEQPALRSNLRKCDSRESRRHTEVATLLDCPLPENIIIDSSGNIVIFDNNGAAYNVVLVFVHHHPNSDHVLYHQRGSLDVVFDHSRANNLKLFKHDLKLFKHPCDNDHYGATARHTTPSMHGLEGCRCWGHARCVGRLEWRFVCKL